MSDISYSIGSKLKTPLIGRPYVVYQLIKHYTEWYDSSFGNGGGEDRERQRVLISHQSLEVIKDYKKKLEIIVDAV